MDLGRTSAAAEQQGTQRGCTRCWVKASLTPCSPHPAPPSHLLCPHHVLGWYWVKTKITLVLVTMALHVLTENITKRKKGGNS